MTRALVLALGPKAEGRELWAGLAELLAWRRALRRAGAKLANGREGRWPIERALLERLGWRRRARRVLLRHPLEKDV